jgi:hypothetical protein
VNWDAAIDKKNSKMSIGVIVRDLMGEVLATLSAPKDNIIDLTIVESLAALRATIFAR